VPDIDRILDQDSDGLLNVDDNCKRMANADQADLEHDGTGDACDDDRDGDGALNEADVLPDDSKEWTDMDSVDDRADNCRGVNNPTQSDADEDGIGDACDSCTNEMTRCEPDVEVSSVVEVCNDGSWAIAHFCDREYSCNEGACTLSK
jgi:hypothetical protein